MLESGWGKESIEVVETCERVWVSEGGVSAAWGSGSALVLVAKVKDAMVGGVSRAAGDTVTNSAMVDLGERASVMDRVRLEAE